MVVGEMMVEDRVIYFMLDRVKPEVNRQIDSCGRFNLGQEYTKGWLRFPIECVEVLYTNQ